MYLRSNDTGNGRFEITAASAATTDTAPRGGGAWSGFGTGRNERHTSNRKVDRRCVRSKSVVGGALSIDHSGKVVCYSSSLGGKTVGQLRITAANALEDIFELERGMSEGERAVTTPRIGWRKLTDPGD